MKESWTGVDLKASPCCFAATAERENAHLSCFVGSQIQGTNFGFGLGSSTPRVGQCKRMREFEEVAKLA